MDDDSPDELDSSTSTSVLAQKEKLIGQIKEKLLAIDPSIDNCKDGGTVELSGSYESNGTSSNYTAKQMYSACKPSTTVDLIIDGSIKLTASIVYYPYASGTLNAKILGSLDVSGSDVTPGTCGILVNQKITFSSSGPSGSVYGSICGKEIKETF
ncbi:MAG: hypothetical protein R3A11_04590 [Bdellovibrionota bacterium]